VKPLRKLNLISDRLQEIASPPKGIFATLFGSSRHRAKVDIRVRLPQYEYLRAEMFVEDLLDLCDDEVSLGVDDLIAILYKDFLDTIARGANQKELVFKLLDKRDKYLKPSEVIKEFVNISQNHLHLTEKVIPKKIKWVVMQLEFSRKAALRGEVFLMDLSQLDPKFQLTLEELISILVIDFVTQLKAGNDAKLIQSIIDNLQDENSF